MNRLRTLLSQLRRRWLLVALVLSVAAIAVIVVRARRKGGQEAKRLPEPSSERLGSGIRVSGLDALVEATETGVVRLKTAGSDALVVTSPTNYSNFLGASATAGTGAPGGTPAEGALYLRRSGTAGTGDLLVGISGAWVSTTVGASGFVPTSRTISTTAPLAGGGNLSADRTFSIAQSGANTGEALIWGGSAWGPSTNFGARDLVTTGTYSAGSGSTLTVLRPYTAAGTVPALYMGVTPGTTNYTIAAGSGFTLFNAPTGILQFSIGNASSLDLSTSTVTSNVATVQFAAAVGGPTWKQADPTNAHGQIMTIQAQNGNGTDKSGGTLVLKTGAKTGAGVDGSLLMAPGGTTMGVMNALGVRFGDATAPTIQGLEVFAGQVLIGGSASSATFGRFASAAASAGGVTNFSGQDGTGSGDRDGGPVFVSGGFAANSGVPGRASLVSDTKELVQAVTITNELRHVVGLARASSLTNTQMPSNSGDYVVYIGNTASAPAANPVSGGILYVEAGALKFRGSSGTVTTVANPFRDTGNPCGPANDNGADAEDCELAGMRDCAGWR